MITAEFQGIVYSNEELFDVGISNLFVTDGTLLASTGLGGGIVNYALEDDSLISNETLMWYDDALVLFETAIQWNDSFVIGATGTSLYGLDDGSVTEITQLQSILPTGFLTGHPTVFSMAGSGANIWFFTANDNLLFAQSINETNSIPVVAPFDTDIIRIEHLDTAFGAFLIAITSSGDVASFNFDPTTGILGFADMVGSDIGLGLNAISRVQGFSIGSSQFLMVSDANSNSLTVLELSQTGSLSVADHIIDTLFTRFDNVIDFALVQHEGLTFVITGGADDGLSVFAISQTGQLVHLQTIENSNANGLINIQSLAAAVVGQDIQIFASSDTQAGVIQFSIDIHDLGDIIESDLSGHTIGTHQKDLIQGDEADETLEGLAGDDILIDGWGSDVLIGGSGSDIFVLTFDGTHDTISDFEVGIDQIDVSGFTQLYDPDQFDIQTIAAGLILTFNGDVTTIFSADGSDITLDDVFGYAFETPSRPPLILANKFVGTEVNDSITGTDGTDDIVGLFGDDILIGKAGEDEITGGEGDDQIHGGIDADHIYADAGNDTVWGGNGLDIIFLGSGADVFHDNGQSDENGDDTVYAEDGNDIIYGGGGNDVFHGQNGRDTIYGGDGNDLIYGGIDPDLIYAGNGNDVVRGGAGRDTIYLNAGDDIFYDSAQSDENGTDLVFGGYGDDTLFGYGGDDILHGEHDNDTIYGGIGNDVIFGGDGNDLIHGGDGDDRIQSGDGDDLVYLNQGDDTFIGISAGSSTNIDVVFGGYGDDTFIGGDADNEFYGQWGNDTLRGGSSADILYGGDGNDTLIGGAGDDTIYGGTDDDILEGSAGNDNLYGGAGQDVFEFFGDFGNDVIHDFKPAEDNIILDMSFEDAMVLTETNAGISIEIHQNEILISTPWDIQIDDLNFVFV